MKTFTLFWLGGKTELVEGYDIQNAFQKAGYGAGSIKALDFHSEGDKTNTYEYDKEKGTWKAK